jgi:hypothetical protein
MLAAAAAHLSIKPLMEQVVMVAVVREVLPLAHKMEMQILAAVAGDKAMIILTQEMVEAEFVF